MLDRRILDATSVAIVGASRTPTKRGFQAIRTLQHQGFEGAIYPVNPKVDTIAGLKCYPKVSDIPGPVDVALFAVPAQAALSVMEALETMWFWPGKLSTNSCAFSCWRSMTISWAPAWARRRQIADPIPPPPPVTMATWPVIELSLVIMSP